MDFSSEVRSLLVEASDYEKIRDIPSYGFSDCEVAEHKETKHQVFLKRSKFLINASHDENCDVDPFFYKQLYETSQLMHPAINPIEGYCLPDSEKRPIIISSYAANGFLDDRNIVNMNPTKKAFVALGVASALKFLHNKRIFDLNLKPSNILLDKNFFPRITDFNFTRWNNNPLNPCQNVGSILYLSPEHISGSAPISPKSDVYAFGLILYRLFVVKSPFDQSKDPISEAMKFESGYRPEIPHDAVSPLIEDLIMQCWAKDPKERPSSSAVFDMLTQECKEIIEGINEQSIILYLRALLDFDNGIALGALGDDRGKFDISRVLYLSLDAPNVLSLAKKNIKQYANEGDKDAAEFLKRMENGDTIDSLTTGDSEDQEEVEVTKKKEKKKKVKASLPKKSNPAIVEAAYNDDINKIKTMIVENVDINSTDNDGETALSVAAKNGNLNLLKYLLTVDGVNVNAFNLKGYTPLHQAAKFGYFEIVKALVATKGIELSLKDKMNYTPLDWAATDEMKNFLIKNGAKSRKITGKK